jgi:hypothetical protein
MDILSAIGALGWVALGVAATLVAAYVAHRIGWLQITIMREAHALNVSKAMPQVGCDVRVIKKQILPQGYNPHLALVMEIYNEGELAVRDVTGDWTVIGPGQLRTTRGFQKDFLGKNTNLHAEYEINESANWPQTVTFDIDVEFYYMAPGQSDREHFHATYRFEAAAGTTRRIASDKPLAR